MDMREITKPAPGFSHHDFANISLNLWNLTIGPGDALDLFLPSPQVTD
jgi:hypothetical protein